MPINKVEGQKKDGQQKYRVRVNYTDTAGNSRQIERTAYGLAEAKALESALMSEHKNTPAAVRMTVRELYNDYVKQKALDVRETTLDKCENVLKNNVLPFVGEHRLDRLSPQMLSEWKMKVSARGNSVKTNQNAYSAFKTMLNYAVRMDYLAVNPLNKVANFKDAYEVNKKEKLKYYTKEEFAEYIACARKTASTLIDWGVYVFFNIAFLCGLRKGEINALKWSDIEDNKLNVRRSIAQKLKGEDRETPPKNKSSYRTLQIPIPLMKILDEHKKRQKQLFEDFSDDFRVCGGQRCLRDSTLDKKNREYAELAKLHHIRIHDFRHSHATLLANAGINIQEISRRLGHTNIEMTWNVYSHLYPQEEEKALEILNKI